LRTLGINWEVEDPVIFHATAEARQVFLQAWSDMDVHLYQLRLVMIPNRLEVHSLAATSADITDEVHVVLTLVSDIITSVEALASRDFGSSVEFTFLTILHVINIETRTTEANSETW